MERISVIINPAAGGKIAKAKAAVARACEKRGVEAVIYESDHRGGITKLCAEAVERGEKRIIILGGDGTIGEAVKALHNTGTELAVVSCGTGNDWIRSIDVPADFDAAAELAFEGTAKDCDVLDMEGTAVCNYAGAGLDCITCIYAAKSHFKGSMAYLVGLLRAIKNLENVEYRCRLADGTEISGKSVLIGAANGKYFGGGIPAFVSASPWDGYLEVLIADDLNRRQIVKVLGRLLKGTHESLPIVKTFKTESVEFTFARETPSSADGELYRRMNLNVKVLKGALKMVVPQ